MAQRHYLHFELDCDGHHLSDYDHEKQVLSLAPQFYAHFLLIFRDAHDGDVYLNENYQFTRFDSQHGLDVKQFNAIHFKIEHFCDRHQFLNDFFGLSFEVKLLSD